MPDAKHRTTQYSEQWIGTGSWPPEATALSDARLQAGGIGRAPRARACVHPQFPYWLLPAYRRGPTSPTAHDRVVAADPGNLAHIATPNSPHSRSEACSSPFAHTGATNQRMCASFVAYCSSLELKEGERCKTAFDAIVLACGCAVIDIPKQREWVEHGCCPYLSKTVEFSPGLVEATWKRSIQTLTKRQTIQIRNCYARSLDTTGCVGQWRPDPLLPYR